MDNLKRSNVKVRFTSEDGKVVTRTVKFVKDGCTYFYNAQHLFLQLERGQRALFDFLCEQMDLHTNEVYVNKTLKTSFIDFVRTVTSENFSYELTSVDQFLQPLIKTGLLLRSEHNSLYIVNPKYAYAGSEVSRQQLLRSLIEERFNSGLDIQKMVDTPIEDFLR